MEHKAGIRRWPAVKQRTGLSRTTVWRMIRAGKFPAPVRISQSAVGWREADLDTWEAGLKPIGTAGSMVAA